jgi:hypothetical protein
MAHELDAFRFIRDGVDRNLLYALLIEQDQRYWRRLAAGYGKSFAVPDQWQGRTERLRVIGDKRAGSTTALIDGRPGLLDTARTLAGVPIRVVCVTRNPYDTVAKIADTRDDQSLVNSLHFYAERAESVRRIQNELADDELIGIRLEDVVADTASEVSRLCDFMGVDAPDSYLAACRSTVFENTRQSRDRYEWPSDVERRIEELIAEYSFLSAYGDAS